MSLKQTLKDHPNIVENLPRMVPNVTNSEEIRDYLYNLLTLRHGLGEAAAKAATGSWKYGGTKQLLAMTERQCEKMFGGRVGRALYWYIQDDVFTDFVASFEGLVLIGLLSIATFVSLLYVAIVYNEKTSNERWRSVRRLTTFAGPITFAIIMQFPRSTLKNIFLFSSIFFTCICSFVWMARFMQIEFEKDEKEEEELFRKALAEDKERKKKEKEDTAGPESEIREAPSTSEDEGAHEVRKRVTRLSAK
ncbi:hypothetical protein KEM55_005800 [Ascosphaera atra]|nr:hypothetical protein KEM55_005800 [Ascosphaera atra]